MSSSDDELRFDRASVAASRDFRQLQRNKRYVAELSTDVWIKFIFADSVNELVLCRAKNRIVIPNDQGFLRLWGNGSKKSQNATNVSLSSSSQQDGGNDNRDAVNQEAIKSEGSAPDVTTSDNQGQIKGSFLPGTLYGCNSTDLSIAQTHDDLYTAHRDAYDANETPFTSNGFISPPDPVHSAFGAEWREALRELSAASRDLDDARDDFSRCNASRKERILNAINETREECRTLVKVMLFDMVSILVFDMFFILVFEKSIDPCSVCSRSCTH
jgi:hypothetical protein